MAKTPFLHRTPARPLRLSLEDGPNWTGICYHDIRAYSLEPDLLVLHHSQFLITLHGTNLRQLYLSLLVEEVYEIPIHTGAIPPGECAVTDIAFQQILKDD